MPSALRKQNQHQPAAKHFVLSHQNGHWSLKAAPHSHLLQHNVATDSEPRSGTCSYRTLNMAFSARPHANRRRGSDTRPRASARAPASGLLSTPLLSKQGRARSYSPISSLMNQGATTIPCSFVFEIHSPLFSSQLPASTFDA